MTASGVLEINGAGDIARDQTIHCLFGHGREFRFYLKYRKKEAPGRF